MLYVSVENPLVCGLTKELCKRESQMKLKNHETREIAWEWTSNHELPS